MTEDTNDERNDVLALLGDAVRYLGVAVTAFGVASLHLELITTARAFALIGAIATFSFLVMVSAAGYYRLKN